MFNQTDRHILPILLPDPKSDCRKFTSCNEQNCSRLKINTIKAFFNRELVSFVEDYASCLVPVLTHLLLFMLFKIIKEG